MSENLELQRIASRLAGLYVEVRRLTQPNYILRDSPVTQDVFVKAARRCVLEDITPEDFVQQQYENKPEHQEFFPSMLLNKFTKLRELEQRITSAKQVDPEISFHVQCDYLKTQLIAMKRNLLEVLLDDEIDLYPWFRVLITDEPEEEVLVKYRDSARAGLSPKLVAFLTKKGFDLTRISKK